MPKMGTETRKHPPRAPSSPAGHVSIADALFTGTQQRVLGFLFGNPQRSFFATELIGLTGGGSGAVQRELLRLERSGLVTTSRTGNQKHYRANGGSPVFDELVAMVTKTFGLADPIRRALAPAGKSIELALLFGSVAKGSDTATSDIDLLVVSDELQLERIFKLLNPVEQQLRRRINPTLFTSQEFLRRRQSKDGFVARVLQGQVVPLIGGMDAAQATGWVGQNRAAQDGGSRRTRVRGSGSIR